MSRVYVSLPLDGPAARLARDVLRGAELALERDPSVELVVSERSSGRAARDPDVLAYLGDFHSGDVAASQAVLGPAGILQVAPVATWTGLGGPTLVRLSPHDGVGARAIAAWLAAHDVDELLLLHDHDAGYGRPVGALCARAARERGIAVTAREVGDHEDDPGGAGAVLYVGVAGSGALAMWEALHAADPQAWLLGSEGVAQPWFARGLSTGAAARTRCFVAQRASFGLYGYEAMALILDTGGDVTAARATRDRVGVLGRYSLDAEGHTTNPAYGCVAVEGGELVWAPARPRPRGSER